MKIYLSGPMFGYPDDNEAGFFAAAHYLRSQGHEVLSPREWSEQDLVPHGVLKAGLHKLLECDHLVLLSGWRNSRGCLLEVSTAILCGLAVLEYDNETLIERNQISLLDIATLIQEQDKNFSRSQSGIYCSSIQE